MDENVRASAEVPRRLLTTLAERQDELNYVARVLHEQIGQVLTVVGLHLDLLRQDFSTEAPALAARTSEIQDLLEKAIDDVRQLSYRLNPDIVQRSGLRFALDTLIGKYRDSSGMTIRLLMDSHIHVPLPVATALYQIVNHSLDNAIRHSGAKVVEIVLQQSNEIRLEIRDNGAGFDLVQSMHQPKGLGLLWMQHLAAHAGLNLRLDSAPNTGTQVKATYQPSKEDAQAGSEPGQ